MKDRLTPELMAMRVAKELKPGDCCNLGIGLPQQCASYIEKSIRVQTENGALGYGPLINMDNLTMLDADLVDAGSTFFTPAPGMCFFDLITSFAMMRSGRLVSVLGGLQVSEKGDLAIHSLSAEDVYVQVGGSMDLAWGARKLIVAMTHNTRDGAPKVVRRLTMPVTASGCVDLLVTDIAVIEVMETGLLLRETAPGWTPEDVQFCTEAILSVSPQVREMEF
jgi:3-oxoacid CoA-transferase B subunit